MLKRECLFGTLSLDKQLLSILTHISEHCGQNKKRLLFVKIEKLIRQIFKKGELNEK
jgi:anti-anti-sigma regulatory factor